jgi:hypothetical protein
LGFQFGAQFSVVALDTDSLRFRHAANAHDFGNAPGGPNQGFRLRWALLCGGSVNPDLLSTVVPIAADQSRESGILSNPRRGRGRWLSCVQALPAAGVRWPPARLGRSAVVGNW